MQKGGCLNPGSEKHVHVVTTPLSNGRQQMYVSRFCGNDLKDVMCLNRRGTLKYLTAQWLWALGIDVSLQPFISICDVSIWEKKNLKRDNNKKNQVN